jgi:hypothetical protein
MNSATSQNSQQFAILSSYVELTTVRPNQQQARVSLSRTIDSYKCRHVQWKTPQPAPFTVIHLGSPSQHSKSFEHSDPLDPPFAYIYSLASAMLFSPLQTRPPLTVTGTSLNRPVCFLFYSLSGYLSGRFSATIVFSKHYHLCNQESNPLTS